MASFVKGHRGVVVRSAALNSEPNGAVTQFWRSWHPVERVDAVKSEGPHRRQMVELFGTSEAYHADLPIKRLPSPNRCASWSIRKDGAANISRRGWCSSRAGVSVASC